MLHPLESGLLVQEPEGPAAFEPRHGQEAERAELVVDRRLPICNMLFQTYFAICFF